MLVVDAAHGEELAGGIRGGRDTEADGGALCVASMSCVDVTAPLIDHDSCEKLGTAADRAKQGNRPQHT